MGTESGGGVTRAVATPVALGNGVVRNDHGLLPVPGPAVLALLTAAAPAQDSVRGVIRGTVFSEPAGLPIPLAVVEADNGRQTVHAVSDSTVVLHV